MHNHIKGLIFSQQVADALGLATEFLTKEEISFLYPNGGIKWNAIIECWYYTNWTKSY